MLSRKFRTFLRQNYIFLKLVFTETQNLPKDMTYYVLFQQKLTVNLAEQPPILTG